MSRTTSSSSDPDQAGAVVARRLVDAGASVLLLEAGATDDNPAIHDPPRLFELWDSEQDWGYRTVPQAACAGRELHLPRGKVLGGSSALNGMIYVRGHRSDYDTWAYLGNAGWGYDDVLPLFKRSEDFDLGRVRLSRRRRPAAGAVAVRACIPSTPPSSPPRRRPASPSTTTTTAPTLDGVGFAQLNIRDGVRDGVTAAFLNPVLDSAPLTVLTGARATRLLFDGTRCTGVELVRNGIVEQAHAEHEVVVCAGTIESPKLLLLSGIGDGADLSRLGIDVVVDLPGVGRNLHDHVLSPVIHASATTMPEVLPGLQQLHSHLFCAQPAGPSRPRPAAALLPPAALPRGHGGPARRLHADGRGDQAREPRLAHGSPPAIRASRRSSIRRT